MFEAYWGDLADISQDSVMGRIVARVGLDRGEFFAKIGDPAYKEELRANTDELIARGGFGSPTMFVNRGDMYFGNDRLELVRHALERGVVKPALASAPSPALAALLECLALEALDRDLYLGDPGPARGACSAAWWRRNRGGRLSHRRRGPPAPLAARLLPAAGPPRRADPLHGRPDPRRQDVHDPKRRGPSGGEAIFNLAASFAHPEPGISHQDPVPEAPPPESLEDWDSLRARALGEPARGARESAVGCALSDGYDFCDLDKRSEPRQRNRSA